MRFHLIWLVFFVVIGSTACTGQISNNHATPSSDLSPTQLKYLLTEKFGGVGEIKGIFYCDPDQYPISIEGREQQRAIEQFETIKQDVDKFQAILHRTGLEDIKDFSVEQKLLIYQEDKKLNAIMLEPSGQAYTFRFHILDDMGNGFEIEGNISKQGIIKVAKKTPGMGACPICLAEDTHIDTPIGLIAVRDLRTGMTVWTLDNAGARIPTVIIETARTSVPVNHQLVSLLLEDGRELHASPGHPLADGRLLGTFVPRDEVDGAKVVAVEYYFYRSAVTYDILPAGETGVYWAEGIPVRSTLFHNTRRRNH